MLGMELKTSKVQFLSFISVTWRMKDVNAKKKERKLIWVKSIKNNFDQN